MYQMYQMYQMFRCNKSVSHTRG